MKLRLLTVLLVCAAALSCGEEWSESVGDKKQVAKTRIGFSTLFETRAEALTDPAGLAAKGGFSVWTYSHSVRWDTPPPSKAVLLDGATVTGNAAGTEWSYAAPVDWPSERFVSFFACAPAGTATVNGETAENVPKVGFTVNPAPANQVDFLIARPIYDQTGPSYANARAVNIRFAHALSRIVFSGFLLNEPEPEGGGEKRTIKIKSITLNGLYDTGTTALSSNPAMWTVSGPSNASYTLGMATGELKNLALTAESQYVTAPAGYLFLMPQSLGRATGQDATMTVTLDIDGQTIAYPPSPLFSPSSWEPGKTYNYQIIIDGDELQVIGFEINPLFLNMWEIAEYINPVMMAAGKVDLNNRKIDAAMKSLQLLSNTTYPIPGSRYFALYFGGAMDMNVTIDMNDYRGFKIGDVVMLDAKKLITRWDSEEELDSEREDNFFVEALFDPDVWELTDAAQPAPQIYSKPEVDATSGPTKLADSEDKPSNKIQNRGSIILQKRGTETQP